MFVVLVVGGQDIGYVGSDDRQSTMGTAQILRYTALSSHHHRIFLRIASGLS